MDPYGIIMSVILGVAVIGWGTALFLITTKMKVD